MIPFDAPDFKPRSVAVSGTGKVPTLVDGEVKVWELLAILEYLAEKFPDAGLWPKDVAARAHARVVANEMHGGFHAVAQAFADEFRAPVIKRDLTPEVVANVQRIEAMWADCRARFGGQAGRFLFGAFCAADAMYAPVVSRLHTYDVDVGPQTRAISRRSWRCRPGAMGRGGYQGALGVRGR